MEEYTENGIYVKGKIPPEHFSKINRIIVSIIKLKDYLPKGKVDDIAEAILISFNGLKKYYEINERK